MTDTPYQTAYPTLPPGFDHELVRQVRIPHYPNKTDSSFDTYVLDLRPLFVITEQSVDFLLCHVPAWWATIQSYHTKAEGWAKAWRNKAIKKAMDNSGCTRAEAKNEVIYNDHDFVVADQQAQWLERMAKALHDLVLKSTQSFNANLRQQYGPGMAPGYTT